jgi:hypothetical protein
MTDFDSLYRSVKDDLNKLATYLMAFGEQQVKKRGREPPSSASGLQGQRTLPVRLHV